MLKLVLMSALLAAGVFASPAPKRSGKSVYENHVLENGAEYMQKMEIDINNGVERFQMPAHNDIDAVDKVNDFKKGYSVSCFRERSPAMCTLADLSRVPHVDPEKLELGMMMNWIEKKGEMDTKDEEMIKSNWVVTDGPLGYTDFLSAEMQQLIGDLPLYRVEPLPEDAEILEGRLDAPPQENPKKRSKRGTELTKQNCAGGRSPEMKYGITKGSCERLYFCDDAKRCQKLHPSGGIFYACWCCPGMNLVSQCNCQALKRYG